MPSDPSAGGNQGSLSQEDFLRLLIQNERGLLRFVMTLVPHVSDAQEVVQETVVALWQNIESYDANLPFLPWACGFAVIKTRDFRRKNSHWHGFLDDALANRLIERRKEIEPELDRRIEVLQACLEKLSRRHRLLIEKYYFDQLSVEAVAQAINISVDAVYKSLQRVRSLLMACIAGRLSAMEGSV